MKSKLFAGAAVLSLVLSFGCGPSTATGTEEPQSVEAAATCSGGQRVCPKCDGSGTYCAVRCFECAPL